MTPSFDLIEQPFIPCVRPDGRVAEYGLRDVLLNAAELVEVRDESPLVTVALHRLLLAILHRCYQGPKTSRERVAIHQAGRFDAERIGRYFEKWADRFDLFHTEYPFYQRPGFSTDDPSGANQLAQERSRGNNAVLFDHTTDEPPPAFIPAQAARALIAEQAFAVGGGKSDTGNRTNAPLVSGAVVLVRGDRLFDTLWLNLTLYDGDQKPVPGDPDTDRPVWEREPVAPHTEPAVPFGYVDYLTWQSRTLRLLPDEEGGQWKVRRVCYAQGRKLEIQPGFYEPMSAFFRRVKTDPFQSVRFNEYRDLWRDSAPLFQITDDDQELDRAPTCVQTLSAADLKPVLPRSASYRLSVFGLCTDKAKVNFWRHETLPLPLAYLDHQDLVDSLKRALALAETVARDALRPAVWATAANRLTGSADMKPDTDRVRAVVDSFAPDRLYWSRLELPFRELLVALAGDGADHGGLVSDWFWRLRTAAVEAFDGSIGRIDAGRDLKAVNAGRGKLLAELKKLRTDPANAIRDKAGVA